LIGQQVCAHAGEREAQQEVAESAGGAAHIAETTIRHKFEDIAESPWGRPSACGRDLSPPARVKRAAFSAGKQSQAGEKIRRSLLS
jgi:hypothetical protein